MNYTTYPKTIQEKTFSGLIIPSHCVVDAASKAEAASTLFNWHQKILPAKGWIKSLEKGHTIQPSSFAPRPDGTYTHARDYWNSTHFVCADADNILGVEENLSLGIEAWTEPDGLEKRFPVIEQKVYAVGESVSSMSEDKPPPHRRYRLIFLFDSPITSIDHYHQIIISLAKEFPIIPADKRSPAQPVFGNAREGLGFHICGNVLPLKSYPFRPEVDSTDSKTARSHSSFKDTLSDFLIRHNLDYKETGDPDKFWVPCPYKSHHTGGESGRTDAYVFNDGKWAFKCSHTSCAGRGWQDFKDAHGMGIASRPKPKCAEEAEPAKTKQKYQIDTTNCGIDEIVERVHEHWKNLSDDSIFVHGDMLCRISERQKRTEPFDEDTMHLWLAQRFDFYRWDKEKEKKIPMNPIKPWIIRALLKSVPLWVPDLDTIYQHPVILPDGKYAGGTGYNPEIKAWTMDSTIDYHGLDVSKSGIKRAKAFLLDDLLADFLFEGNESKANYLAYLLTFPMRPAIRGHVPFFAVTAPVQGAGKSLLLDLASIIWTGKEAIATQVGSDGRSELEEMRKRLTALLMESPESIIFDNAVRIFNSAALASALTTGRYRDRLLGSSRNVEVDVRTIMAATGNNLSFGGDMPRRVYWCKLKVDREKPETRKGFLHPLLVKWAAENRAELMKACLTIIKGWTQEGMPLEKEITWGGYEEWTQTIGGILKHAGMDGFLQSRSSVDSDDLLAMREFCSVVDLKWGKEPWTASEAFEIASHLDGSTDEGILDDWLGSGKEHSRKTRLGMLLSKNAGRYFGDFKLIKLSKQKHGKHFFSIRRGDQGGTNNA